MPLTVRHEFEEPATIETVAHALLGMIRNGVPSNAPFRVTVRDRAGNITEIGAQLPMADEHPEMAPDALGEALNGSDTLSEA